MRKGSCIRYHAVICGTVFSSNKLMRVWQGIKSMIGMSALPECLSTLFGFRAWVDFLSVFYSYSMRHFVAAAVKHLKDQRGCDARSIWTSQLLTVLCVHSDNAAQHFKSSKSLHWLSKQIEGMGFKSVLWDFGPPGHGKVRFPAIFSTPSFSSPYPTLKLAWQKLSIYWNWLSRKVDYTSNIFEENLMKS